MNKKILKRTAFTVLFATSLVVGAGVVTHFTYKPPAPETKIVDIQQEMITNACGFPAVSYNAPEYKYGQFWPAECGCNLQVGCGEIHEETKYYSPDLYKD